MVDDPLDGERPASGFRFLELHGSQNHFQVFEVEGVLPAEIRKSIYSELLPVEVRKSIYCEGALVYFLQNLESRLTLKDFLRKFKSRFTLNDFLRNFESRFTVKVHWCTSRRSSKVDLL